MTTTAPTKNVFPFFKLPRELRDNIYEQALETRTSSHRPGEGCGQHLDGHSGCVSFQAINVPVTPLLTVCRRFNQEYTDRAAKFSMLVVTETGSCKTLFEDFDFPKQAQAFTRLRIDLHFLHPNDINDHHEWLAQVLAGMKKLQDLSIRIHMLRRSFEEIVMKIVLQEAQERLNDYWTSLPHLHDLEVREIVESERYTWDESSPLILKLSEASGKVEKTALA